MFIPNLIRFAQTKLGKLHYSTNHHNIMSFFDLKAKNNKGEEVDFKNFAGNVCLTVNVASRCGYTSENYKQLQPLYEKYKEKGFVVLAFPCNQFGAQESGTNEEIATFCTRYNVSFPLFDKVDVNGSKTSPVYQFLKSHLPGDIQWNFAKYLVDKNGNPVKKYGSAITPNEIEKDIVALL
eukprot:TRINITY_DN3666_c0_g1_i4.p1 TRINITY_DN3666_c0_g1~~TRINITY_DN3666_c0_g1_i4.p1  ORF type:complete len:180 (+),score=28.46 TRINITY_DN3666_c0_g1_i4:31-570(+)